MKFSLRRFPFPKRPARTASNAPLPPEFGVRVVLRHGDKIVRRTPNGRVVITRITEPRGDWTEILRPPDDPDEV